MKFREICSLQYSIIINIFWVDPLSDLLKNALVKPKNYIVSGESLSSYVFVCVFCSTFTAQPTYSSTSLACK